MQVERYVIAGIDVHKKMLAVVVTDAAVEGEKFERARVPLYGHLESHLEDARLKLSSSLSDLLGVSGRWMLQALSAGETDAAKLAGITDKAVRATPEQWQDALCAAATLQPLHRQILRLILEGPS